MTAARADEPGTIPERAWTDVFGSQLTFAATTPTDGYSVLAATSTATTSGVALTSGQLRELGCEAFERADHLDNVPGRYRRTWRWHLRKGEQLLSQSHDHVRAELLVQQATAHFTAAAVLRGHTTVQINQSGKDNE